MIASELDNPDFVKLADSFGVAGYRAETPEALVLMLGADSRVRVAKEDIADLRPGAVSVMPTGLEEQLSRQELADLLAFLKNTRWGAE